MTITYVNIMLSIGSIKNNIKSYKNYTKIAIWIVLDDFFLLLTDLKTYLLDARCAPTNKIYNSCILSHHISVIFGTHSKVDKILINKIFLCEFRLYKTVL